MREILPEVERWRREGKRVAIATVVEVRGSAPRPLGAKMAVSSAGDMAGSVSGGCVEGAVFEEAQAVMKSGRPRLLSFGISDDMAWEVGLACGGAIQVFVEALPFGEPSPQLALYEALRYCLDNEQLVALATVVAGPGLGSTLLIWPDGRAKGGLGRQELDERALDYAAEALAAQEPGRFSTEVFGDSFDVFMDIYPPLLKLFVVGAVHIAVPLVTFAKTMGFRTIVVDARSAFASRERFPHADELVVEWPSEALERLGLDEGSYVVVLSHDEKLDNPALQVALRSSARYIGALGSTKTHAKRLKALKRSGLSDEQLARIHAPIGLNLGARSPEEIALSIMAEIVAVRCR